MTSKKKQNQKMVDVSVTQRLIKAQQKAEDFLLQQQFKDMLLSGEYDDMPYKTPTAIRGYIERYSSLHEVDRYVAREYPFVIVTCNSKKEFDDKPDEFIKVVEKATSKKWINNAVYVYEQREKDQAKKWFGLHTHILIEREGKRECEIRREFKRSFKNVCDTNNSHCLNFRFIKVSDVSKVVEYLIGKKASEDKQKGQVIDVIMRTELKLEPFYEIGRLLQNLIDEPTSSEEDEEDEEDEEEETEEEEKPKPNYKDRPKIPMPKLPDLFDYDKLKKTKSKNIEIIEE